MLITFDMKADTIPEGHYQLRTPLTQYKVGHIPWALDNGCFTEFKESKWIRMVLSGVQDGSLMIWFTLPDEVGDHYRTRQLFDLWYDRLRVTYMIPECVLQEKAAFVLQDGVTSADIPWSKIGAVFLGGTTGFKLSRLAYSLLEEARLRGKWTHVGRVNTPDRATYFHRVTDSIDGSGLCLYTVERERMLARLDELNNTIQMTVIE